MDLSGMWLGAERSPELDRSGADPDLDDSDWAPVPVPGHWGEADPFYDSDGPIVYRRRFRAEPPADGQRAWLRFDGILTEAEIWLDGQHLGDTQLYYAPHRFDITDNLRNSVDGDAEHLLAVDVSCGGTDDDGAKRSISGSLQSGPLAPPGSPGGIWRSVGIDTTGPVAILSARLLCVKADKHEAVLQFRVALDASAAGTIRIDTSVVGPDGSTAGGVANHDVASGENHIEWTARIAKPHLWWPAGLGEQPRYDVGIAVRTDGNALSDRRHWRTGLRTATVDELQWTINDERLFVKGIAVGPHDRFLARVDEAQFATDVETVRDAGLNLIRVYGHVSRPELYEAADDLGLLIWQDLPLVGTYATGTRSAARAAARAAVDELGHHPSVVVWCGHDEPNGPPLPEPRSSFEPLGRVSRRLGRHLLPSWNRSVLDPLVRRELRAADPSRSVITRSGNLPSLLDLTRSDAHLWLGWHVGQYEDLPDVLRHWPRLGVFLGALGAQSAVVIDWPSDGRLFPTAERGAFNRYIPRGAYADGLSWALATRAYQADVIRSQIETVRRLKYNPTGGFCVVALFDPEMGGGFGVLEDDRSPKPAFGALVEACQPVVVIADPPPSIVTPGYQLSLAIHAVSDLRTDIRKVQVTARAQLRDWEIERRWEGHLPADSCNFIGNLELVVPNLTGALVIELEIAADDHLATNRYQTVVIPPSEAFSPSSAPGAG